MRNGVLIVLAAAVSIACAQAPKPQNFERSVAQDVQIARRNSVAEAKMATREEAANTVGNFSWIPVNQSRRPDGLTIARLLDGFERKHPDLEVVSWQVLWGPTYDDVGHRGWSGTTTHGVVVLHRPRAPASPERE